MDSYISVTPGVRGTLLQHSERVMVRSSWKVWLVCVTVVVVFYDVAQCEATQQKDSDPVTLRIGAFNIQVLGVSKIENEFVVRTLVQILTRYDLVLIQEVRDVTNTAIHYLLACLNMDNNGDVFNMSLSQRLGSSSSKEQYAFFYRQRLLSVRDVHQWRDENNVFERPPYIIRFHAPYNEMADFGFIAIHTQPLNAPTEIDALVDVYDSISETWNLKDFIIGGDFNAGCRYVTKKEWEGIRLRHDDRFLWLIGDEVDTTITSTDCPYDRLVLAGNTLWKEYVNGSAITYRFDVEMDLTEEQALDISDHAPVEMLLG